MFIEYWKPACIYFVEALDRIQLANVLAKPQEKQSEDVTKTVENIIYTNVRTALTVKNGYSHKIQIIKEIRQSDFLGLILFNIFVDKIIDKVKLAGV